MSRQTARWGGFAAGVAIALFMGALGVFIYTGAGLSDDRRAEMVVYPNL